MPTISKPVVAPSWSSIGNAQEYVSYFSDGTVATKKPTRLKKVPLEEVKQFVPKEDVILRFFLSASSCGQVFFRLYYQRPELKPFASKEGYYINFSQSVQLDGTTLYLWGSNEKAHRRVVAYNCGGESAAENYKTQVLSTLVEYVNSMREVPISFPLYNQCDIYEL